MQKDGLVQRAQQFYVDLIEKRKLNRRKTTLRECSNRLTALMLHQACEEEWEQARSQKGKS